MLGHITRGARLAADTAAYAANQVVDRYAYPGRQDTYPASMLVGRRSGGPALAVTLLLALGLLWLAASQRVCNRTSHRRKGMSNSSQPMQTWEGEGGARPPAA